jgi:biotin carboxyl carrier protein
VVAVRVQPGDAVEAGQTVVVVEAMKMEHRVAVTHAGIVATVSVAVGDQVVVRQPLLTVTPAAPAVAPATD